MRDGAAPVQRPGQQDSLSLVEYRVIGCTLFVRVSDFQFNRGRRFHWGARVRRVGLALLLWDAVSVGRQADTTAGGRIRVRSRMWHAYALEMHVAMRCYGDALLGQLPQL